MKFTYRLILFFLLIPLNGVLQALNMPQDDDNEPREEVSRSELLATARWACEVDYMDLLSAFTIYREVRSHQAVEVQQPLHTIPTLWGSRDRHQDSLFERFVHTIYQEDDRYALHVRFALARLALDLFKYNVIRFSDGDLWHIAPERLCMHLGQAIFPGGESYHEDSVNNVAWGSARALIQFCYGANQLVVRRASSYQMEELVDHTIQQIRMYETSEPEASIQLIEVFSLIKQATASKICWHDPFKKRKSLAARLGIWVGVSVAGLGIMVLLSHFMDFSVPFLPK